MSRSVAAVLAFVCIAAVVADGRRAVSGLSRPHDHDQFRDIAAAQAIADGHPLRDPFYRNETIWYNPLVPALVAAVSRVSGWDVHTSFVLAGPWLNALAPLALFVMTAALFGRWPAFIAVVSLLFAPPHDEFTWATPTYSPWLFPSTFSPAFFYLGVLLCWTAARRDRPVWWLAAGVGLGATFLAHTAPALILGLCGVVAVLSAHQTARDGPRAPATRSAFALALLLGAAILTSAPLIWSILGHYQLRIVNPAPNSWVWSELTLGRVPHIVYHGLTVRSVLPAVGAGVIAFRVGRDIEARLLACWGLATSALLAYGFLQPLRFLHLPPLLPAYHFYLYFRAAGHVLTGIGMWTIVHGSVRLVVRRWFQSWSVARLRTLPGVITVIVGVGYVAANVPAYRNRPSFQRDRSAARQWSEDQGATNVRHRLRAETPPGAVILASSDDSLFAVAPAGRFVVAAPLYFSNPYVDFDGRAQDQQRMLAAFVAGDLDVFRPIALRHGVTHVLLDAKATAVRDAMGGLPAGVVELSRRGGVTLYAIAGPDLPQ